MREYGIDLVAELPRITLRRFMVLVRGLGLPARSPTGKRHAAGPAARPSGWPARRRSRGRPAALLRPAAGEVN